MAEMAARQGRMGKLEQKECDSEITGWKAQRPIMSRVDGNYLYMHGPRREVTGTFRRRMPYGLQGVEGASARLRVFLSNKPSGAELSYTGHQLSIATPAAVEIVWDEFAETGARSSSRLGPFR